MASWVSSAVSFIAGSAASAVVEKIVDAGFVLLSNLRHPRGSEVELTRLKTALPQIKSVMGIAEAMKAKDPSYGEWFEQFRIAIDASENVLDELEYKKLEEEVKRQEAVGGSTSSLKKQKSCPISEETLQRLQRLREAVGLLDQATSGVDVLLQRAKSLGIDVFSESWKEANKVFRQETTSLLVETKVFGREDEKEKIIGWLKQSTTEPLSVFGIVGMGGLGKTTLMQLGHQKMKESNYFDHTIWVCVSIEFNFESLTKKVLGELGENNYGDKSLNALQEILKRRIQSKKIVDKDELIKMWIAAGFIQQKQCDEKQLEDVGEDWFNYLVRKSFLEYFKSGHGERYVMHDLIHDLAQSVSNGECCSVEPNDKPLIIPKSVRHISIHESEIERISHLENLHTLVITSNRHMVPNPNPFVLRKEIIKNSLRLLRISTSCDCQLSVEISDLVHLRYLSVHTKQSMLISVAIHKLYHLQVLYLDLTGVNMDSSDLGVEPSRMNNLVNLRYMRLPDKLLKTIHGVHKLTSLRELTFFVGEGNGHYIHELGTLKDLRKLSIYNIENVGDPAKAKSANLLGKTNLRLLSLNWSLESKPNNPEQIIDNLQASPDLMELIIQNYKGQRSPIWMEDSHLLNLSVLTLRYCPNLDKMFDIPLFLTEFRVEKVGLTTLPNLFRNANGYTSEIASQNSSLKIVEIKECPKLESLDGFLQQGNVNLQNIEKLTIQNCWKLTRCPTLPYSDSPTDLEICAVAVSSLPNLPLSLTTLKICDVPLSALPGYNRSSDSSGGPSTESLQSPLRTVTIENCPYLTLLSGFLQQEYIDFQSLKFMNISNCRNLVELPIGAFGKFVSLRNLVIRNCPMLVAVDDQRNILPMTLNHLSIENCRKVDVQLLETASRLTTLTSLHIKDCANVTHIPCLENTLPATVASFTSLEVLHISRCELLEEIKALPTSLRILIVYNAKSLKSLPPTITSLISLIELDIYGCELLEEIQELPTSLRTLRIRYANSPNLLLTSIVSLTSLEELHISQCKLQQEIQELPASLRILRIQGDANSPISLPSTMPSLIFLEELNIMGCKLLGDIPELPSSLRILKIQVQPTNPLRSLRATMANLTALKELQIWECKLLEEIPELPTSLRMLGIWNANSFKSLCPKMARLPALEKLYISGCESLEEIQELPNSLKTLGIQDANSLKSLRTAMASLTALEELLSLRM